MMSSSTCLMPEDDLCARLCFVCFDGEAALKALEEAQSTATDNTNTTGNQQQQQQQLNISDDDFVAKYCTLVADGIQALVKWVENLKATN